MIAALPTMLTSLFGGGAAAAAAGGAAATGGAAAEGATAAEGAATGGAADSVSMSPAAQMMMNNSSSPYGAPSAPPPSNPSLSDPASADLPGVGNSHADQNGDLCGVRDQFSFDDDDGSGASDAPPVDTSSARTSGADQGSQLDADSAPQSAPETDGQDIYTPSDAAAS